MAWNANIPQATDLFTASQPNILGNFQALMISLGTNIGIDLFCPIASIQMYAGTIAPTGWLLCDGGTQSRITYAGLFSIIGTIYGSGDGSSTFNIPDFRGIYPKGAGQNGTYGANYTGTLGLTSLDKAQGHKHGMPNGGLPATSNGSSYSQPPGSGVDFVQINTPISDGVNGTPRTGLITEPANIGINFIIKY